MYFKAHSMAGLALTVAEYRQCGSVKHSIYKFYYLLHLQVMKLPNLLLAICALEAFLATKVAQTKPAVVVQPNQSLE